jgi:hypothetical protein
MRITAVEAQLFSALLDDAKYDLSDKWHNIDQVDTKEYYRYFDKIQKKIDAGATDGRQFTASCRKNNFRLKDNIDREIKKDRKKK